MTTSHDKVLLIDDDKALRTNLSRTLELAGHSVVSAEEPQAAREALEQQAIRVLVLDLQLPGISDLEFLEEIRSSWPNIPVIVMTAYGSIDRAVRSLKLGAFDFIQKPVDRDRLLVAVRNALEREHLVSERTGLLGTIQSQHDFVGDSPAMCDLREKILRVAPTEHKVTITGETGSGKELVAAALFAHSSRTSKPYIKVNCAAIPRELIESELFGYRKGAFTDAKCDKPGKFKLADGGTLFLDEIGDMDISVQAKVLRALREGEIEQIGGNGAENVDVRVIAATNQNLEKLISEGKFRQDLYYRICEVVLRVPPVRERREDIQPLMEHFLDALASRSNKPQMKLRPDAVQVLVGYDWPGNVAELQNLAGWLMVFASGPLITVDTLNGWFRDKGNEDFEVGPGDYANAKEAFEREYFRNLLIAVKGNVSEAARIAGLDRSGLYRKLKSLGAVD